MQSIRSLFVFCAVALSVAASADEVPDNPTLDATFGNAGKVTIGPTSGFTVTVANDVVVQPDGKIVVVGYEISSSGQETWRITRLAANGQIDTTFGTVGTVLYNGGSTGTRALAVALRPDGRIVVGGNYVGGGGASVIEVAQFTSSGAPDPTFGSDVGYSLLQPPGTDTNSLSRLIAEADGSIDVAGTYHQQSSNNNNFFFDRVASDGKTDSPFQFVFGGPNADDHGLGLTIDAQGRYLVSGYHRGAAGNYDCAVIRVDHDLYDVDRTFGYRNPDDYGYQIVAFDLGGDNFDSCNTVIMQDQYVVLGGNATKPTGGGTYQAAALAMLDDSGSYVQLDCASVCINAKFTFAYGQSSTGAVNTIGKLILDPYETKYPYVYAIGAGRIGGSPHGTTFGLARIGVPAVPNSILDPTFNGGSAANEYFITRPDGLGLQMTDNAATSAAFGNGKLVIAGSTDPAASAKIAVARFMPFDGLFKNGYDAPYF